MPDPDDTWTGGYYELAVLLGPRDDARLAAARAALWRLAGFAGTPPRGLVEPVPRRPVAALLGEVREEVNPIDWVFVNLPMGALSRWHPAVGAFPFGPEGGEPSRSWREPLEAWLLDVGRALFAEVPFVRAITGFEASALGPEGGGESGHHGLLIADGGALTVIPVSRWDFGRPA
jgi:hypothetical protein